MDELKRSLVRNKISYDIKNNLIEKESHKLGYLTRYSSGYLARLLLSQYNNVSYDFIINDGLFHGYIKDSNTFVNVIFLEYGYNFTSYFKNNHKYLNECENYFKNYLINNNLEKELDIFGIVNELSKIDNILDYSINNKLSNITYNLYLYFYEDKSILASDFEKYINDYINTKYNIKFNYSIKPITELYSKIKDKDILERLEYYDLLPNDYTYEKIIEEVINKSNITVEELINKYSISHRTAYYIKGEYDIYNDMEEQYISLLKLIKSHNYQGNTEIIDQSFIRSYFSFSSELSSVRLNNRLKEIVLNELIEFLNGRFYDNAIKEALLEEHNHPNKDSDKKITKILKFNKYLDNISNIDLSIDKNISELITKFVEQIYEKDKQISIKLYSLNRVI